MFAWATSARPLSYQRHVKLTVHRPLAPLSSRPSARGSSEWRRKQLRPLGISRQCGLPVPNSRRLPCEFRVNKAKLTRRRAGDGPFARFVLAFRAAIGRHAEMDTVIDAIKDARTYSLQHPSGWGPSPFDD